MASCTASENPQYIFLFFLPKDLHVRYISGMTIRSNVREKPNIRERLLAYGAEQLSDVDLLAVLLHTGMVNKPVTKLAEEWDRRGKAFNDTRSIRAR